MTIKPGDKIPSATFMQMKDGKPTPVTSDELFGGKTVILFALAALAAFALPKSFAPDITRRGVVYLCGALVMLLQLTVGQGGNILDVFFQASPLDRGHGRLERARW